MLFPQEQNEALLDLLNLIKHADNHLAMAETSLVEKTALQLTWKSGVSVYSYVDESIAKTKELKRAQYPQAVEDLAKILNTQEVQQVAKDLAGRLCNVDGKRDEREGEMLTMMYDSFDLVS